MRIANSPYFSRRAFLLASVLLLSGGVVRVEADPVPPADVKNMPAMAVPAGGVNMPPMPPLPNKNSPPMLPLDGKNISTAVPIDSKNLSAMEDRAVDNAHSVIRHLDSSDAATVDDLNSARQAVARIDAMIAVETHLADLEKARGGGRNFASSIPASALMPPPGTASFAEKPHPSFSSSGYEISRISGSDGKYTAVLKNGGEARTVKVGDTLAGGGTVRWISASSVLIEQNGTTHSLHVKNVDTVYSAMR